MDSQGILQNRRFIKLLLALTGAIVIYLVLLIFPVGGELGLILTKDIASVIFSVLTFWFFFSIWLSTDPRDISRRIWGAFAIGILLWAVAEIVWAFYEVILEVETPYPSLADLFWVLGYFPLFWGLSIRYKTLVINFDRRQKTVIVIFIGSLLLLTSYFVFRPIIMEFDPLRMGENLLNVFYPLSDLVLLILTSPILFSFGKGRFALTWRFIVFGFAVMSVADLFFSYLSWYGLFYPDGNATVISILVDTAYNLSYILLSLGIYTFAILLDIRDVIKLNAEYGALGGSKILVFIDSEKKIISASANFIILARKQDKTQYEKRYFHEILGLDEGMFDDLIATLKQKDSISNYPLRIGDKAARTLVLTAIALRSPKYDGAAIVLQTELDANKNKELPLTEEQKGLVESFLKMAGASVKQETLAFKAYFLEQINLLYELVYEFDGQHAANSLLGFISQKANENGWQIHIDGHEISIPAEYEGEILSTVISHLLKAGRFFAANVVSLALIDKEMNRIDQELKPDVLQIIDRNGLRIASQAAF